MNYRTFFRRDIPTIAIVMTALFYFGAYIFLTYMPTRICVPGDIDYRISK